MESTNEVKTVPDSVPYCRGTVCTHQTTCERNSACSYRSSADEFRAQQDEQKIEFDNNGGVKAQDFTGRITGKGYKASMDDPKKIPLSLIDPTFTDGIGRVLQHGAKKYKPGNWLNGMSWREVISALRRHLNAVERGEDTDPETGELHVYHIGCCNMFLARYMSDSRYSQFDDRMFKEAAT